MASDKLSKPLEDELERLWEEWEPQGFNAPERWFDDMRALVRMAMDEQMTRPEIEP